MTPHFSHGTRYARSHGASSPWLSLVLAVASWFAIAGIAGLVLLLGTS
ncbi:hypothetical protein GXW82_00875 [Streptacidiphilus sp. 4-A2]|nr:hypothetical protein [Streptacidiphilus sp. 4-A2]